MAPPAPPASAPGHGRHGRHCGRRRVRSQDDPPVAPRLTVNRSGTTHSFRLHRRKAVTVGVLGVAMAIGFLAFGIAAAVDPAAWQIGRDRALFLAIFGGAVFGWAGICAFRMGVRVRDGEADYRRRAAGANGPRWRYPRDHLGTEGDQPGGLYALGRMCRGNRREKNLDRQFRLRHHEEAAKAELAATVDEVRALLGVPADLTSMPESR
jgi:hypothetical protein